MTVFDEYYRSQIKKYFMKQDSKLFDVYGNYKDIKKLFLKYDVDLDSKELHSNQFMKVYNLLY
jgi:hypothetical protein